MGKKLSKKSQKNRSKKTQRNMKKVKLTKKQKRRTNKHYKKRRTNRKKVGVKRGGMNGAAEMNVVGMLSGRPALEKVGAMIGIFINKDKIEPMHNNNHELTDNKKRLKMIADILQFVDNETEFRSSMQKIRHTRGIQIHQLLDVLETINTRRHKCHPKFTSFIGKYYYMGTLHTLIQNPDLQDRFIATTTTNFCDKFHKNIEHLIRKYNKPGVSLENLIDEIGGINPTLFNGVVEEMKETFFTTDSGTTIKMLDLENNNVAKHDFYEYLTYMIMNITSESSKQKFNENITTFLKNLHNAYLEYSDVGNKHIKVFIETMFDRDFWLFAPDLLNTNIRYFLNSLKMEVHRNLMTLANQSNGSIIHNLKEKINTEAKGLWKNFKSDLYKAVVSVPTFFGNKKNQFLKQIQDLAFPHELYGHTDEIIFNAFLKLSQNSDQPFMNPENILKLKTEAEKLKVTIKQEQDIDRLPVTASLTPYNNLNNNLENPQKVRRTSSYSGHIGRPNHIKIAQKGRSSKY